MLPFVKFSCKYKTVHNSFIFLKHFNSCVPKEPFIIPSDSNYVEEYPLSEKHIDISTISHLEKLSLVNFGNSKGIDILVSSIKFANSILKKDTSGVTPLTTVLENRILPLRTDIVSDGNCRTSVIANAKEIEEEYFVAPPGNIPVEFQAHTLKEIQAEASI